MRPTIFGRSGTTLNKWLPDVTNTWIKGQPAASSPQAIRAANKDPKRVMVVYGRNLDARDAVFTFLRSLKLSPIQWEEAIAETGMGSPHNLDAVEAAMDIAQAVVVILTPEDQAGLLPQLAGEPSEVLLEGQPRQNVTLEAGMAMGIDRARTILVEIGRIRRASDFEGLNALRLGNDPKRRGGFRTRLRTAGCELDDSGTDWLSSTAGGDFDECEIRWEPQSPDRSSGQIGVVSSE